MVGIQGVGTLPGCSDSKSRSNTFFPALTSCSSVDSVLYFAGTASVISSTMLPAGRGGPAGTFLPVLRFQEISIRFQPMTGPVDEESEYFPAEMVPPTTGPLVSRMG